ncbi:hypothetical protein FQN60_000675 [Etheostoma spectabile]|uniref:Uncharacterized protein n=1 Tax=Etheostoma spectabile TaxID=54343 RepID=A0A5J5D076_9PERO|nr:hypothetical protein FQN60_000675 [Etheostoma spectabile]
MGDGAGGRGVCQSTEGLYFDYGAFVVMGDGRRGGATCTMALGQRQSDAVARCCPRF